MQHVLETVADSTLARINFSGAHWEIYLHITFQGGNRSLGWKMRGRIWTSRGYNRMHNQAKLSSTYYREPKLTQQYLIKEEPKSRQAMLQGWKCCPSLLPVSPASELNSYITPLPYSATLVAFYLLTTMSKKLKLKALSIMSFPVSSHCCGGNNGVQESWQRH